MTDLSDEELARLDSIINMLEEEMIVPVKEESHIEPVKEMKQEYEFIEDIALAKIDEQIKAIEERLPLQYIVGEYVILNSFNRTNGISSSELGTFGTITDIVNNIKASIKYNTHTGYHSWIIYKEDIIGLYPQQLEHITKIYKELKSSNNRIFYNTSTKKYITLDLYTLNYAQNYYQNRILNLDNDGLLEIGSETTYVNIFDLEIVDKDNPILKAKQKPYFDQVYTNDFKAKQKVYEQILEDMYPDLWYRKTTFNSTLDWLPSTGEEVVTYCIRFPELHITNSKEHKHTIYDLCVFLRFDKRMFLTGGMLGRKFSWSKEELNAQYSHSHISIESPSRLNLEYTGTDFCIGSAQPIGMPISILQIRYDPEALLNLCMQLELYLSWESLEGGPYTQINTITQQSSAYSPYYISLDLNYSLEYHYPSLIKHCNSLEFNKHKFNDFSILEPTEQSIINKITELKLPIAKVYKKENGEYLQKNNINYNNNNNNITAFIQNCKDKIAFQFDNDKEIKYKLIEAKVDETALEEVFNPSIIKNIIHSLTRLIN